VKDEALEGHNRCGIRRSGSGGPPTSGSRSRPEASQAFRLPLVVNILAPEVRHIRGRSLFAGWWVGDVMSTGSGACSRRWVRIRRRVKVTFGQIATTTVDLCSGGFCALLLRTVPPGTPVEGIIQVNGRDIPYAGRVVWAKAGDVRLGIRGRIGVGFASSVSRLPALLADATAETFMTASSRRPDARFAA
jgi:hypothetical protein